MTTRDVGGVRDGYHSVNAYLVVEGVERLVAFLEQVFDAKERGNREIAADATIAHAEVVIGDSVLMLSESSSKYPSRPSVLFAYVADVDRVFECAIDAGASPILSPEDQPWAIASPASTTRMTIAGGSRPRSTEVFEPPG